MIARILIACLLGLGAFTTGAASAVAADGLYDALLKATPTSLPPGVGAAQTAAVAMDDADKRDNVIGILQVTFQSKDPLAKMNYVFFADAAQANAYIKRFIDVIGNAGARQIMLPYLPQANCAASAADPKVICGMAVDRVAIFSWATESPGTNTTGPVSLAGPSSNPPSTTSPASRPQAGGLRRAIDSEPASFPSHLTLPLLSPQRGERRGTRSGYGERLNFPSPLSPLGERGEGGTRCEAAGG